ncbi:hypothetical protein G4Y79_03445 [Phototrophicus methaneseepsis]|uniref:ABC transporter permease n=1 Tax=Phototrophicus methaneseepsis TaxID=2710758 RepID=A0A7S8EAT6_9CHLR|nr:hypothetical protein [Phototrophicus methaneseepsis]QPC83449.1 hypothetical protein G4Y79_03445 [Phototrophicus methaneseepsis]
MSQLLKTGFTGIRAIFGGGNTSGDAWIDTATEALTPRESLVARVARILQWAAIIHALVAVVLGVLLFAVPDTAQNLGQTLFSGASARAGDAMLLTMIGVLVNMTAFLLLAVAAMAQETWTWPFFVVMVVLNVLALIQLGFLPAVLALIALAVALVYMVRDVRAWHANPVSVKELRGRMRGVRAFAIITIFLLLMSAFTVLLYLLQLPAVTGGRTIVTGELGRLLFIGVVGIELVLVVFIVPALTAGAVSGERERKTYDLLQTTLLSAPMFLVGKMESALGYIVLLLASAIPLQSIAFLFGGVGETEVIVAFVILMVTGLVLGALGLYFSAQTERTLTATVRVYTVALVLCFGVPLVALFLFQNAFGNAISGLPAAATRSPLTETLLIYGDMLLASINPITAAFYTQQMLIDHQQLGVLQVQLASSGDLIPVISPWLLMTLIYLATTAVLILLAVRRMRRTAS